MKLAPSLAATDPGMFDSVTSIGEPMHRFSWLNLCFDSVESTELAK
jgi:hypothetical protein